MIETAIAIIATCLPALRSMILGTNTTKASSNSYGRHYELSSARRRASSNRLNTSHIGGGTSNNGDNASHQTSSTAVGGGGLRSHHNRANGSEDSLFSDSSLERGYVAEAGKGITVNTQIETMFEDGRSDSTSMKGKSPFV